MEDKINITLVITESVTYKKMTYLLVQPRDRIFVKGYKLFLLLKTWSERLVKS